MPRLDRAAATFCAQSAPMAHHYTLVYRADGIGEDKRIEFHGRDPGRALLFAHEETGDRQAELWRDGERLCTIRRVGERPDYWMIGPAGS
jgi:hypothetical protein